MMMAVGTVIDRAGRDDGHNTAGNMEYCWEKKRRVPGYMIRLEKQKREKRKAVALLGVDRQGQARTGEIHAPIVIRGRWWLNWRPPMETRLGSRLPARCGRYDDSVCQCSDAVCVPKAKKPGWRRGPWRLGLAQSIALKPHGCHPDWLTDMTSAACRGQHRCCGPIKRCMSLDCQHVVGGPRACCDRFVFSLIPSPPNNRLVETMPCVCARRAPGSIFRGRFIVQTFASIFF